MYVRSSRISDCLSSNLQQPVPDTFLINGVGYFNCSAATIARPVNCVKQPVDTSFLKMDFGVAYRIRVVNTG